MSAPCSRPNVKEPVGGQQSWEQGTLRTVWNEGSSLSRSLRFHDIEFRIQQEPLVKSPCKSCRCFIFRRWICTKNFLGNLNSSKKDHCRLMREECPKGPHWIISCEWSFVGKSYFKKSLQKSLTVPEIRFVWSGLVHLIFRQVQII